MMVEKEELEELRNERDGELPIIECPDGKVRSYADFEDIIKPQWKEQMRKEDTLSRKQGEKQCYLV